MLLPEVKLFSKERKIFYFLMQLFSRQPKLMSLKTSSGKREPFGHNQVSVKVKKEMVIGQILFKTLKIAHPPVCSSLL